MPELLRILSHLYGPCDRVCAEYLLADAAIHSGLSACLERLTGLKFAHLTTTHTAQVLRSALGREYDLRYLRPEGDGWYSVQDATEEAA